MKGYNPANFPNVRDFCTVYRKAYGVSRISVLWGLDEVIGLAIISLGSVPYFSLSLS